MIKSIFKELLDPVQGDVTDHGQARLDAFEYQRQSAEQREKAKEYHRRKQGQTASYYASNADTLAQKAKEEHERAADAIFARQNQKHQGKNVIDLHGLHIDEGLKRLNATINQTAFGEILVITGRGKNSRNHNGRSIVHIRETFDILIIFRHLTFSTFQIFDIS